MSIMRPDDLSALELLVLVRLLSSGDKGEKREKLNKDLHPLWSHRLEGSAWAERLDSALGDREEAGSLVVRKKGKAEQFVLTDEGKRLALEAVGLEDLPPKMNWGKLKNQVLVVVALGKTPEDVPAISSASGLKTELLRAKYGLSLGAKPTAKQAGDALAGALLAMEPGSPFTTDQILRVLLSREGIELPAGKKTAVKDIQEALFGRELGDDHAKKPLDRIAARIVGARQDTAAELAQATLRSWVDRADKTPVADGRRGETPLGAFAEEVVAAARASESGWFGDGKVFISHVWRAMSGSPACEGLDEAAFKDRLVAAHRARWLELGRADLVEAMDPSDVRESATMIEGVPYHFVRTEGPAR